MALRNATQTAATVAHEVSGDTAVLDRPTVAVGSAAHLFEDTDDVGATTPGEVIDNETGEAAPPQPAAAPAPTSTSTAVAAAPAKTALDTVVRRAITADTMIRQIKWAIPEEELTILTQSGSPFPRITVGPDGFSVDKTKSLGRKIEIELVSWNPVWYITSGEQTKNPEADKAFRISYNKDTLRDGEGSIDAYVAKLRDVDGYKNAKSKAYTEIYATLVRYIQTDDDGNAKTVEIPEDSRRIHQLSLSPQSGAQWGVFQLEQGMRKAQGGADGIKVVATSERKVDNKGNIFGRAIFGVKW